MIRFWQLIFAGQILAFRIKSRRGKLINIADEELYKADQDELKNDRTFQ